MRFLGIILLAALLPAWALAAQPQGAGSAELLGAQAILFAENAARAFPGEYTIRAERPPKLPPMKAGKVTFEAERPSKQEPIGRFFVVFRVYLDGIFATTARVELEGAWSGALYRAKNTLQRKATVTESDLEAIHFEGVPPAGAVKDLPKGGVRLRQPMAIGKLLTQMDLEPIPLVSATDRVRVTLRNGGVSIQGDATARSNGAKGDVVRLEMDGSRKLVQGVVTGPCQAVIDMKSY
jgi:flagella basal body P-ring formation protein FlgA